MGLTRLQLEDRCLQFGYGDSDRTRFTDFLNMAYRDILNRHRWSWNRTVQTINATVGTNSITLDDATYIYFGRLRPLSTDAIEPEFISWDTKDEYEWTRMAFDSSVRGVPTKYTILNDSILFNCYFNKALQYELNLWPVPAYMTLSSSEPLLPDEDRETLVWGALMYQCMRDKDWAGAERYNNLYEGRIDEMWSKDRTNSKDGTSRVLLPAHYGYGG